MPNILKKKHNLPDQQRALKFSAMEIFDLSAHAHTARK